jgi:hypothetical protein
LFREELYLGDKFTNAGHISDLSEMLPSQTFVRDRSTAPVNDSSTASHNTFREAPAVFEDTELFVLSEVEPQISVAKSKMLRWDAMDERSEGRVERLYQKKRIRKGSIDDQRLRKDLLSAVSIEAAGWVEWKGERVYFKRCITAKKSGGLCGAIVIMPGSQQNHKTTWYDVGCRDCQKRKSSDKRNLMLREKLAEKKENPSIC